MDSGSIGIVDLGLMDSRLAKILLRVYGRFGASPAKGVEKALGTAASAALAAVQSFFYVLPGHAWTIKSHTLPTGPVLCRREHYYFITLCILSLSLLLFFLVPFLAMPLILSPPIQNLGSTLRQ